MIYIMSNELQHYGVKGMKWGVRHDPVSTGGRHSSGKKKMSTAKKVAIGLAITAAAAGLTYAAIKSGKAQQIAKGAARLAKSRKSKPMSGYELRKMGISTFEPNRIEINRGTQASAARQAYYQKHGKSFTSSNITKARKIKGYSNKNYTDLGRAYYKNDLAQKTYNKKLKTLKFMSDAHKKFGMESTFTKRDEILGLRSQRDILVDDIVKARGRASETLRAQDRAINRAYHTGNYKRTKSIKFRKLN